mmetsp:Transcript_8952/g.11071  ORF Transcript_8952/g.11071 Transcript_8952/m.11071 type:complete len:201 (+) Transcript_8952:275-877(+)|eukprot:CAMPEP_0206197882 /NCGR_PEP_ID=MMETSP0166-20121206/9307_1 /ASSEMBLY_ACC=CAM_ASM_000260 /TAXON_ID=95228 /ORGANISM="Vannella robusta, Strain DIVA3 518/3/11/1/6" /LENGTH=200 /DNA_ID=CAMNT_0053615631 /DNA_START=271 /DNA_END=873 /DNA_ORIENTATION=+
MLSELQTKAKNLQSVDTVETDRQGNKTVVRNGVVIGTQESAPGFVVDTKPDPQVAFVCDGLFVGSQDAALNVEGLQENKVTHILNLVEGIKPVYEDIFTYATISLLDVEDEALNKDVLEKCFAYINEAKANGGGCLVHCNAGVSRSCSVVLAYRLMNEPNLSLEDALTELKQTRKSAKPNAGFMVQLKKLADERNNKTTE